MSHKKRKPQYDDLFRGVEDTIAAFLTAVASTVLEVDNITRQPDPVTDFLESLEHHIDETQTLQALSSPQRDFLKTLFSTLRADVLARQ